MICMCVYTRCLTGCPNRHTNTEREKKKTEQRESFAHRKRIRVSVCACSLACAQMPWNEIAIEIYGKRTIYTTFIGFRSLACSLALSLSLTRIFLRSIPIAFNLIHVGVYFSFFGFVCRRTGYTQIWVSLFLVPFPLNKHTYTYARGGHRTKQANKHRAKQTVNAHSSCYVCSIHLKRNDPKRARFRLSTHKKHRSAYGRCFFSLSFFRCLFWSRHMWFYCDFVDIAMHAEYETHGKW